jgi:hypothetical protein
VGPSESPTRHHETQAAGRRERRPRQRRCLLKGCEQRFHPRQARQRYCSEPCREAARRWSQWKAQQRYRETAAGQEKRNGQSRRYRERVKSRKPPIAEAVSDGARLERAAGSSRVPTARAEETERDVWGEEGPAGAWPVSGADAPNVSAGKNGCGTRRAPPPRRAVSRGSGGGCG